MGGGQGFEEGKEAIMHDMAWEDRDGGSFRLSGNNCLPVGSLLRRCLMLQGRFGGMKGGRGRKGFEEGKEAIMQTVDEMARGERDEGSFQLSGNDNVPVHGLLRRFLMLQGKRRGKFEQTQDRRAKKREKKFMCSNDDLPVSGLLRRRVVLQGRSTKGGEGEEELRTI